MIKCFIVHFQVIAFGDIGSRFAAVRTLLPSHRRIGADAASVGANEVGEASIARSEPPTSDLETMDGWNLCLPPQRGEGMFDVLPQQLPDFESRTQSEAVAARAYHGAPRSGAIEEPSRSWGSPYAPNLALTPTGQTVESPRAAFVGAGRLLARLLLHQVRPHDRSVAARKQRIGCGHNLDAGAISRPAPNAGAMGSRKSERPPATVPAASLGPPLTAIETLLAGLAQRRLRDLAAMQRVR